MMNATPSGILLIQDDCHQAEDLAVTLKNTAQVDLIHRSIKDNQEFYSVLDEQKWNLILCDFNLSTLNPVTVLQLAQTTQPPVPVILIAEEPAIADVVKMVQLGAYNFVATKDKPRLVSLICQVLEDTPVLPCTPYREIIETISDIVCRFDAGYKLTFFNRAFTEWCGQPADQLLGTNILDQLVAEQREPARTSIATLTPQNPTGTFVQKSINPNQTKSWIEWEIVALFDKDEKLTGYQGTGRNITNYKSIEEDLRVKENAIASSIIPMAFADLDDRLTYVNPALLKLWKYDSEEEVVGRSVLEFWEHPEQLQKVVKEVRTKGHFTGVMTGRLNDGSLAEIEFTTGYVTDASGRPVCLLGSFLDVTERIRVEERLRDSEAQQQAILSAIPDLLFRLAPDGTFIAFHGPVTSTLVPPEVFLGKQVPEILPEPVAQQVMAAIKQVNKTRQLVNLDYEMFHQEGIHSFEARLVPLEGSQDTLAIIRDITDRKSAEADLRASEEKYRSLIESANASITVADLNGYCLYLNEMAAAAFGVPPEQLVGKHASELFPPAEADQMMADIDWVVNGNQGKVFEVQVTLAGKPTWFRTSLQPVRDGAGKPYAMLAFSYDITDEILAQRSILAQNEILRQSKDLISMADLEGNLTFINQAGAELLGGTQPEQFIGQPLTRFHTTEDGDRVRREYQQAALQTGRWKGENRLITLDGRLIEVEQAIFPILDDKGNIVQTATIIADITERKQAENALRASEKRYRQMFEFHGLPKLIVDPDSGKIFDANPSACQYYGYDLATLKTLNIADINISPRDEIHANMGKATSRLMQSFRFVHRLADGSLRNVEVYSGPIEHDGRQMLYSTITDITERERIKDALEEANRLLEQRVAERTAELERVYDRLEAIFNHSGDAILMLSVAHGIQQANYTFAELFNTQPEDYLGMKLGEFFMPESSATIETVIQEVAATHVKQEIEARTAKTGLEVEISLAPVNRSEKAVTSLVCIIRDISARKQVEAAVQKYTAEIHDLYNHAPTGYHSLDKDGTIVQINDTELEWLGYSREEVVGKLKLIELLTPPSQATFYQNFPLFQESGWLKDLELEFIRKEGSILPVVVNATAIKDESGNFLYSRSTLFDITDRRKAQQAVAEERNLLRTLIDTIPDFIYVKDTQHRMVLNNLAHAHSLKLNDPAEAMGRTDYEFFPAEMAAKFTADEDVMYATGQPVINTEERSIGENGQEIWALTTKVPLRNLNGELIGLVGITHDISVIKAGEEALQRSERQLKESQGMLQLVLDTIPVRVFWKDRDSVYQGCNRLFAADAGLSQNYEVIGKLDSEMPWAGNEADAFRADDLSIITTGQPKLDYEETQVSYDGTAKIVQTSKLPLQDEAGIIVGLLGVYTDITDRKRAENDLRESEEKFRQFIESAPIPTIISDQDGQVVLVNKAVEDLFGYDRSELISQPIEMLIPDEYRLNHPAKRSKFIETTAFRPVGMMELAARRKDGSVFPADIQLSYPKSQTGHLVMCFVMDITKRKQAEQTLKDALVQEKELGDLKSRFVSTASHEFRTPLASILATAETLTAYREKMVPEQIDARLNKIKQQVLHMKDIMEDVLQLAKMQAGRVNFSPAPGDLNALCLEIIEEFESQPQHQGRITYLCTQTPVTLDYDPHLLRQVVNNLISNALKYSPQESRIRVELSQEGDQICLRIIDQGIGIPSDDLKRLFEPFHRASNVGTIAGTGLGLSIARQSVEIHGGRLVAESQVGAGTTMIMTLPSQSQK